MYWLIVHFAYSVMSLDTLSVLKSQELIQADSIYQPEKVYPASLGAVGAVIVVLFSAVILAIELPPLLSNVTVN